MFHHDESFVRMIPLFNFNGSFIGLGMFKSEIIVYVSSPICQTLHEDTLLSTEVKNIVYTGPVILQCYIKEIVETVVTWVLCSVSLRAPHSNTTNFVGDTSVVQLF